MSPNESTKSFNKRLCQEVKHRSRARPKIRVLLASGSHPSSICSITAQASMAQMPSKRSSRCLSKAISKGVGAWSYPFFREPIAGAKGQAIRSRTSMPLERKLISPSLGGEIWLRQVQPSPTELEKLSSTKIRIVIDRSCWWLMASSEQRPPNCYSWQSETLLCPSTQWTWLTNYTISSSLTNRQPTYGFSRPLSL